jgi:hypothetical protein
MDSLNSALVDCVKAAGGSALVGPKMWPEKSREAAQRQLLDCLSEDRPAKLSPDQVLLVFKLARDKGYHGGIAYVLETLGYAPTTPITVQDEAAELQRQFTAAATLAASAAASMADMVARMERLQPVGGAPFSTLRVA